MRIEISGLNRIQLNRARAQLDAAGIHYLERPENPDDGLPFGEALMALICESDDPAKLRDFVHVALHDPNARVYR